MKIKFRIGPNGGTIRATSRPVNNRGGRQDCPDDPTSLWSPRWPVSTGTPPAKKPADHSFRRGAGACALFASRMSSRGCARRSVADQRRTVAISPPIPTVASCLRFQRPSGQHTVPPTKKSLRTAQFSVISNRNWLKNRSCRKQMTKPCLTGARIAQCDAPFLRDFRVNFLPAEPNRERQPVARRTTQS
jgi:hypothetical protein